MFQQHHDDEDCYYHDHVSYSRQHVYDVYDEDVVVSLQSELLRKVHDELQKMKVCIADSVKRLEKTVKHMVEVVKDMRSSEEKASDSNVQQPSQRCVSLMQSVNSKLGRARTVPIKRKCHTSHVEYPRKIRASTFRSGLHVLSMSQRWTTSPLKPSTASSPKGQQDQTVRVRRKVRRKRHTSQLHFGGDSVQEKHPFDRGKAKNTLVKQFQLCSRYVYCDLNLEDKVLWRVEY